VEISVNGKQAVALVWTIVAIVIALIVVLAMGNQFFGYYDGVFGTPWQWQVALFFGLVLIITVPVYLLIVLWHVVSKWETT
jgi:hypothetical protein